VSPQSKKPASLPLRDAIAARVRDAQRDGDVASNLDPEAAFAFLIANHAGIRRRARRREPRGFDQPR
jgi:TetR/AcrR family transcriptional regulator, transcriptional repressor for nem operon